MYSLGGDVQSSSSTSSATLVSSQFITQYYRTLTTAIDSLYQFYEDDSSVVRVDDAEDNHDKKSSWITSTPQKGQLDIHNVSIPLPVSKVAIKTFDCAESGEGFLLLVHGSILLSGAERTFSQTFLLAYVDGRYYIKNEILRFHAAATSHSNAVATTASAAVVHHNDAASNHLNHHETNNVAAVSTPVKSPKPPTSPARTAVPTSPSIQSVGSPNHEEKKHNRRKRHEATPSDNSLLTPEQKAEKINDGSASPASKSPKVTRGAVHSQQNESIPPVELSPEPVAVSEPVVEVATPAAVQEEIIAAPVQSAAPIETPKVEEKKAAPVKAAPVKPSTWAAIFTKNTPPPTAHSSAAAAAAAPAAAPATATNTTPAAAATAAPAPSSSSSSRPGKYSAKESHKSSTIMISNVPAVAKNDDVQSFFSQFGTVSDIVVSNQGGKSATYVTFTTPSAADSVLAQKSVTLFDVVLQMKRSNAPAPVESSDDGFQSSQNRRHQRQQQRHNDKSAPAPAFVPRGRGRGRGRGGFRGGRGGSNAAAAPAESS